jgi:hypothetical protein
MPTVKWKNNTSNKEVTIVDNKVSGMCNKTLGMTFVTYKNEDGVTFVMEHKEFYKEFSIKS